MSQSTAIAPFVVIIISQMADLFVDHDAPCPSNVRWFDLRREGSRLQCNHHLIITHPMFCVSRPLPKFGRVIRIQSAPDDFVPGTVPLRPKNAGDEVPLISQWSRMWGVGHFWANFFFAFFLFLGTPYICKGWGKTFRVFQVTFKVLEIGHFWGSWGHFSVYI